MAARSGREETLVWNSVTLCAREKSFAVNGEAINISDECSDGFQQLLEEPGEKSIEISISGLDKDDTMLAASINGPRIAAATWTRASGATVSGNFRLSTLNIGAPYNGEGTFEATLQSTGEFTFTPAT